jgi:tetratricopeptide (TPR) repeat protein
MRYLLKLAALLLFVAQANSAQTSAETQLRQALLLAEQGQFAAAAEMAKPLIDSRSLHGVDLGRAWTLLGFAYKEQGLFAAAQEAFDQSIAILQQTPEFANDYAVALDHLGALYEDQGQTDAARHLWLRALKLFENGNNITAIAEVYRDLAELEL